MAFTINSFEFAKVYDTKYKELYNVRNGEMIYNIEIFVH
jgi:hypothetical protein